MWFIYTIEYYSAIKNNEFMKFLRKWVELENMVLSVVTQEHTLYLLTDKSMLAQKLKIPKIQFTNQISLKKKEEQSMDTLVLHRRGNKISIVGDMEIKYGAENKEKTIQRLPLLGIHSICSYKTQTKLWMPKSAW